jgi:hypothetical protein
LISADYSPRPRAWPLRQAFFWFFADLRGRQDTSIRATMPDVSGISAIATSPSVLVHASARREEMLAGR